MDSLWERTFGDMNILEILCNPIIVPLSMMIISGLLLLASGDWETSTRHQPEHRRRKSGRKPKSSPKKQSGFSNSSFLTFHRTAPLMHPQQHARSTHCEWKNGKQKIRPPLLSQPMAPRIDLEAQYAKALDKKELPRPVERYYPELDLSYNNMEVCYSSSESSTENPIRVLKGIYREPRPKPATPYIYEMEIHPSRR